MFIDVFFVLHTVDIHIVSVCKEACAGGKIGPISRCFLLIKMNRGIFPTTQLLRESAGGGDKRCFWFCGYTSCFLQISVILPSSICVMFCPCTPIPKYVPLIKKPFPEGSWYQLPLYFYMYCSSNSCSCCLYKDFGLTCVRFFSSTTDCAIEYVHVIKNDMTWDQG
jgi:hypothetical protein